MYTYLVAIFCEYPLKYIDDIISIIRYREYPHIWLGLERYTMRFEPFIAFFWSKFPKRLFYKIPTSSIFRCEYFFIGNTCSNITSSTSGENYLISRRFVFFKKVDMELFFFISPLWRRVTGGEVILQYCCSSHESCSTSSDDSNCFHNANYMHIYKIKNQISKIKEYYFFFCHLFSI